MSGFGKAGSGYTEEDKESIRVLYMNSKCLGWTAFCEEVKLNPQATRVRLPVADWTREKRKRMAERTAEEIKEAVFNHRLHYRKDVLRTLKEYPHTNDALHALIRRRINQLIAEADKDPQKEIKSSELTQLAIAMKTVTEAKHRSLLLSDVIARVAEESPVKIDEPNDDTTETGEKKFELQIIGMDKVTPKRLQDLMHHYLDQPGNTNPEENENDH